jgi:hypothetical protein
VKQFLKALAWTILGIAAFLGFCVYGAYQGWGDMPSDPSRYHKYRLASGTIVECAGMGTAYCGMYLYDCKNGQRYDCQVNVEPQ